MRVEIEFNHALLAFDIWIFNERDELAQPMELTWVPVDEFGMHQEPSLRLPRMDGELLFQALAAKLDQNGYRPDSLAQLQGTMEAQKYHLEDMRRLVFKEGDRNE